MQSCEKIRYMGDGHGEAFSPEATHKTGAVDRLGSIGINHATAVGSAGAS